MSAITALRFREPAFRDGVCHRLATPFGEERLELNLDVAGAEELPDAARVAPAPPLS